MANLFRFQVQTRQILQKKERTMNDTKQGIKQDRVPPGADRASKDVGKGKNDNRGRNDNRNTRGGGGGGRGGGSADRLE